MERKTDFDRNLGGLIREARERAGVKQDQLARAVGLSRTSISNIERGRQGVQTYLLVHIAEVLGKSVCDLIPQQMSQRPSSLPDKVKSLEPGKREWAERVLSSLKEDEDDAA